MQTIQVSGADLSTIENALNVAAERYEEHAKFLRDQVATGELPESLGRVAEQFTRQAKDARRLVHQLQGGE